MYQKIKHGLSYKNPLLPGIYVVEYIRGYEKKGFVPVCKIFPDRLYPKKDAIRMADLFNNGSFDKNNSCFYEVVEIEENN